MGKLNDFKCTRIKYARVHKESLQILLFETPNLLKFQIMLIYTIEGSSVHGHVIRGVCAERHLRLCDMATHLGKTRFAWKSELYAFCDHGKYHSS